MRQALFITAVLWATGGISASAELPGLRAAYSIQDSDLAAPALEKISPWTAVPETGINHSFSPKHYYLKIELANGAKPFQGILEIPFNRLRKVDLIEKNAQGIFTVTRNGADVAMAARPLRHAAAAFPLALAPGEKRGFYLHIASDTTIKIQLNLQSDSDFFQNHADHLIAYGIYSGLFLLMISYNLILFWAFREKSYLTYLVTNIASLVYYLSFDGIWAQYIMPGSPRLAHALQTVASLFQSGSYLVFIAQFAPVKRTSLLLHRMLLGYGAALMLLGALGHFTVGPALMNKLSLLLAISAIMLGLAATLTVSAKNSIALRLFKAGNMTLVVSGAVFSLFFFGALPDHIFIRNALRIGTIAELIFFSMALATRIRTLDESRRTAEVRAETRTQFAANLSHEIRTPLTAIVGVSDLLAETELSPQQAKYVKSLQSAAQAMHALANDVLTFAKLDHDKMRAEEVPFSPGEVIRRSLDIYRFKAAEKKIELVFAPPEGDIHLLGDPTKIGQILNNLISNALKFTPVNGRVSVESRVAPVANKQLLEIRVTDNGVGIPKEKLARLFEAYEQADATTERLYGGTGLGLTISRQLAKLMNGSLDAASDEGRGSTFTLALYLDLAPALQAETQQDYARLIRQIPRTLHILHIDDQADIRMLFQFYFANTQHQLDSAESAEEGLALYKKHHYDFVFSDIHMPGMGGIKGLEAIREYARSQNLAPHLVLCSGSVAPEEMPRENTRILLKPIRTRDVYAAIVEMAGAT
ncbi:MAG: response regulator [Turneriella sp.]|nr:response regulator [Turneriella sp.]